MVGEVGTLFAAVAGVAAVAAVASGAGVAAVASGAVVVAVAAVAGGVVYRVVVVGVALVASGSVFASIATVAVIAGGAVFVLSFFMLVPAANATLDHLSVQLSRWLLNDLIKRRSTERQWLLITWHITVDVVAAVMFLVLLALLLPIVLQAGNWFFAWAGWPVVAWGAYLEAAQNDPFGSGWLITGMLLTTLIPTFLHLLAAGGALVLPAIGVGTIEMLAAKEGTTLLDRLRFVGLIGVSLFASWVFLIVAAIALYKAVEIFTGPLGTQLADMALWMGQAVGGPGAPGP